MGPQSATGARAGLVDNRGEGEWTSIYTTLADEGNNTSDGTNERENLLNRSDTRQHSNNGYGSTAHDEEAAFYKPQPQTLFARTKAHLNATVTTSWADLILLICFFTAGLVDSGAYNAYSVFTSMQTGNTVFAALGVSDLPIQQPKGAYLKSLTSILSFMAGAMLFGTAHRYLGARKRWVLAGSFMVQATAVIIAAEMVRMGKSSNSPVKEPPNLELIRGGEEDFPGFPLVDLVPIGLLAFQASGKVTLSRVMQFTALPAVVLTTLYNDLMADPMLWSAGLLGNVQRNRRAGGVVMYFLGAVVGGQLARSQFGFEGSLWTSVITQFGIVILWMVWKEEERDSK